MTQTCLESYAKALQSYSPKLSAWHKICWTFFEK